MLVSPEEFDALHARQRVVEAIDRGRADVRAGRVVDDDAFTRELDEELGALS